MVAICIYTCRSMSLLSFVLTEILLLQSKFLMTEMPVGSQHFKLSSHSDVIRNAMHLYGPPVPSNLSLSDEFETQIPPLISDNGSARIFPCMNFTCSGRIKKLIFVALVENLMDISRLPIFGLWNTECISEQCIWVEKQRFDTLNSQLVPIKSNISRGVGVYEIVLTSNISFDSGTFLGVRRPLSTTQQPALLYQRDGGYCNGVALEFDELNGWIEQNEDPILPYIATETGQTYVQLILLYISLHYLFVTI